MIDPKEMLKTLLSSRNAIPELEDIVHSILGEFGGFKNFAKEWFSQYTACKKTPMAASKMLVDFTRLLILVNEHKTSDDVAAMTTEELEAVVQGLISAKEKDTTAGGAAPAGR